MIKKKHILLVSSLTVLFILGSFSCLPKTFAIDDVTAPVLNDVWISPTAINDGETIKIFIDTTDDLSGVNNIAAATRSPTTDQGAFFFFPAYNPETGVYEAETTIPQYSESGTWTIPSITISDTVGNSKIYENGIDYNLEFTVTSLTPDVTAPVLNDVWISPTAINDGETIKIFIDTTDDLSGVNNIAAATRSPTTDQGAFFFFPAYNPETGVYEAETTIPQYSESGTWTIPSITISDAIGNSKIYENGIDYNLEFTVNQPTPWYLDADIDGDEIVSGKDVSMFAKAFNTFKKSGSYDTKFDFDDDGDIDKEDRFYLIDCLKAFHEEMKLE